MAMSTFNPAHLPGKRIVIAGDGPMALIAAIKLKQAGVNDVTLAGMRLGEFTRSGDYRESIYYTVCDAVFPLAIENTHDRHIKDLERQLFAHAQALGVSLLKMNFIGFSRQRKIVLGDSDTREEIHADIVFDITGTRRAVIKAHNQCHPSGPRFEINPVATDIHTDFAFVRAYMHEDDIQPVTRPYDFEPTPETYVLAMDVLQKMGWDSYAIPLMYGNTFPRPGTPIRKTNLYFQIPSGLPDEQLLPFLEVLLKLYGYAPRENRNLTLHKPSRKYPHKQIMSRFHIAPHQTSPGCFPGDEDTPAVFHAGDATADLPFIIGRSLQKGIARFLDMLSTFSISDGEIRSIDLIKFKEFYQEGLSQHESNIHFFRELMQRPLWRAWMQDDRLLDVYRNAYTNCRSAERKPVIELCLNKLFTFIAKRLTAKAVNYLRTAADNITGFTTDETVLRQLEDVEIWLQDAEAYQCYADVPAELREPVTQAFCEMAERYKKLGSYYFTLATPDFESAFRYFKRAKNIYALYAPDDHQARLALYAYLFLIACKQRLPETTRTLRDEFKERLLPHVSGRDQFRHLLDKIDIYIAMSMKNTEADTGLRHRL